MQGLLAVSNMPIAVVQVADRKVSDGDQRTTQICSVDSS